MSIQNRIAVYIVAHQDDWQLFMDPNISADIVDQECRTVIIHTTAGDAGKGNRYWQAREWGAINSLLFRFSAESNHRVVRKNVKIGKKQINMATVFNCSVYFLRLPDGGMKGFGFDTYNYQSIAKIRFHLIDEIWTVDEKNVYYSFAEISGLINEIIRREISMADIQDERRMTLNFPEFDNSFSPQDHNDHLNTALLIRNTEIYKCAEKFAYVHYYTQHAADDLTGMDLFWKVGMFSVYHQTVLNRNGHSTIGETPEYRIWCRKNTLLRGIT